MYPDTQQRASDWLEQKMESAKTQIPVLSHWFVLLTTLLALSTTTGADWSESVSSFLTLLYFQITGFAREVM